MLRGTITPWNSYTDTIFINNNLTFSEFGEGNILFPLWGGALQRHSFQPQFVSQFFTVLAKGPHSICLLVQTVKYFEESID